MNKTIVNILPTGLRSYLGFKGEGSAVALEEYNEVEEIRLRAGRPAILYLGRRLGEIHTDYVVSASDLQEALEYITGFSLYAYESEIREGFITIKEGHRIGVAGKVICQEGKITTISPISSINIRISHEVIGCSEGVMPYIMEGDKYLNTLIISPPGVGKTTLLRDMVRNLSDTYKLKVAIVDERSEIASCYRGVPQCDVGIRSDIYDCCHKVDGIMLMIRAMSPEVVAVDELGGEADMAALAEASRCGCKILATAHGQSVEQLAYSYVIKEKTLDIFDRFIVLNNNGDRRVEVYDRQLRKIV